MEIIELSHNDDIRSLAYKCNANFKQLMFTLQQMLKKQGRLNSEASAAALDDAVTDLTQTTIPNEVSTQISLQDISGNISREVTSQLAALDVPGMIDTVITEADIPSIVDDRISLTYPPVGAYIISDTTPIYDGTTWTQVDQITTSGSLTIPLWRRIA